MFDEAEEDETDGKYSRRMMVEILIIQKWMTCILLNAMILVADDLA